MLRMAGGQYRDLLKTPPAALNPLHAYQELAQAKTGSMFALAFGGTAMLLSDDTQIITALTTVGEIYGTLVQYHDDMSDMEIDQPDQLSFAQSLIRTAAEYQAHNAPQAFLRYVTQRYIEAARSELAALPQSLQHPILDLFTRFTT